MGTTHGMTGDELPPSHLRAHALVIRQRALGERLLALRALVRLLARLYSFVNRQRALGERLLALRALVRLLARVYSFVNRQRALGERLLALRALVRLLARLYSFVNRQRSRSVPFFYFNSQTKSLMPCPKGMTRTGCRRVMCTG